MSSTLTLLFRHWASKLRARFTGPRLVYGFIAQGGVFLPHTRVGSSTVIEGKERLVCADHVFIGHHNFLDASGGLTLDEGCQITNFVSVLTHSSHVALRLHGKDYFGRTNPAGMHRAPTRIGAFVFVGPHCVIAPGSSIGKGAVLRAYSYVNGDVPDFAVMAGQPAVQVGDTREGDALWLADHPELQAAYVAWARSVH